jgi:dTDP-4-dehydrorhamnose reductase
MNKVLVLGHNGMLGHMVAKYLSDNSFGIVTCEYRYPSTQFKEFIKQFDGDFIINCIGAIPQRTKDFSINYELPIWLDANANCKIIHPGTDCEMDSDEYGISKKQARDYIVENSIQTKILKSSIIGPELNSNSSLLEWFLSQTDSVYGYTKAMWNGNTTLEWAEQCYALINSWESYKTETILQGECVSKFELLNKFKLVFEKEITIIEKETDLIDKCLIGNIKTSNIDTQLNKLRKYYYDR